MVVESGLDFGNSRNLGFSQDAIDAVMSVRASGDSGRWSPERTVYGIACAMIERRGVGELGLGQPQQ
jgi:hypothetical protein